MTASEENARPQKAEFEKVLDGADASVAQFKPERLSGVKRLQNALHTHPTAIPGVVLIASMVFFALMIGARFLDPFNFSLIVQQVMIIGIVGVAQTLVILTAGIDLSVGAIMVLSSVVMGKFAVDYGLPSGVAILAGLGVAGLCGLVNGLLVTRFRLPPFIVTLGTLNIFFALNLWYSASETIRAQDIEEKAPLLEFFGGSIDFLGARLTYGSVAMLLLVALVWYVLNLTAWGRHVQAVGDDRESANLAGIRTDRVLLQVYVVAGLICGLAARALIAVPILGSPWLLFGCTFAFIVANLSVGLLFSTLAKNQMQAMQMTFFFFLPSMLLSGFMFPFRGMPGWAQSIGELLPLTHFLRIVRGILLKANTAADVWPNLWPLLAFTLVVVALGAKRFRRTLD